LGGLAREKVMDKLGLPKDFLAHVEALKALFHNADGEKLEQALKRNDLQGACQALGIDESGLEWMIRPGQQFAQMFSEMFPDITETLRKSKQRHDK
jgi:hypothetical protein